MAREPVVQDLEPDNEEIEGEIEGQTDDAEEFGEGTGLETEDTALDLGEEQEAGDSEDVAPLQTRGSNRFQRLANENRALQQRLSDLERRGTPQPQIQQPQEESEEQFQGRISLLPPDERIAARYERAERRNQVQMHALRLQTSDMTDKVAFDAKATIDPRYQRYAAAVEAKRQELMAQGQMVPREVLLKFLIGEKVLANQGSKEVKKQRAQSQQRVARQQVRPTGGRSDVANAGRRPANEAAARAKRLESMEI